MTAPHSSYMKRKTRADNAWCYGFLLPFALFFLGFTLWPLVATSMWAFTSFEVPGDPLRFVGFDNFSELLRDELYWKSFVNTVFFVLLSTAIKLPLALVIAVLLTRQWVVGKRLFRTVFFLPLVVPTAIAGLIFAFLLNPLNGALPNILRDFGLIGLRDNLFLGERWAAMVSIVLVAVWQILGQFVIYWMAALQSIDSSLSEAAQIDGANFWQELWLVTVPAMRTYSAIITFLGLTGAFSVFGVVLTLTSGGPGSETYVMRLFTYTRAFTELPFRYGYISAGALLFALVILGLVIFQAMTIRRSQESAT
ncbi:MAG: carbohydrate ABC transporter permease [Deinococcales bacterium]